MDRSDLIRVDQHGAVFVSTEEIHKQDPTETS